MHLLFISSNVTFLPLIELYDFQRGAIQQMTIDNFDQYVLAHVYSCLRLVTSNMLVVRNEKSNVCL